ncbi:MAG: hypothetical protein BGO23_00520 [Solirubrobacterales bacterium 67-14]|nr:MAG: hypothetical protein BGO23_00520 [Solirubrobacterales bacterium 67-14]
MIEMPESRKLRSPMPSSQEIAAMIPRLGRGARINLKLVDGGEVLGTLYGLFDDQVFFEEEEIGPIDLDRIEDLLVRVHSEQPGDPAA